MPCRDHSSFFLGPLGLPSKLYLVVGLLASAALGCTPKIGDDCSVSTNCSASGDRLCDITQPGGYCTVFNCEPGSCPKDSDCVNFGTSLSVSTLCAPSQGVSPYERSFCMATCESDSDCRGGYKCLSVVKELRAVLAEHATDAKVCAVAPNPSPLDAGPDAETPQVCTGNDAGPEPSGGAGGMSSVGGDGGASGEAGALASGDGGTAG